MIREFLLSVQQIAEIVQGEVIGDPQAQVHRVQKLEDAVHNDVSFLASSKFEKFLTSTHATCLLISLKQTLPDSHHVQSFIRCENPHAAFVVLLNTLLKQQSTKSSTIHSSVVFGSGVTLSNTARIDAGVVIGNHCEISDDVHIHANAVIGDNVRIGRGTEVHANVSIYEDCVIGASCILHANCVIGSDGFGYLEQNDGSFEKIPQIGNVVLEDRVEVGAGACIDRAALGSTVLHEGVKIDNLVHIAHNVEVGKNTAVAALSGIAGGTKLGERNRLAGQVGVVGYVNTVDDVIIGAQSGVSKNIGQPGVYSGSPAVELKQRLRQEAAVRRLAQ